MIQKKKSAARMRPSANRPQTAKRRPRGGAGAPLTGKSAQAAKRRPGSGPRPPGDRRGVSFAATALLTLSVCLLIFLSFSPHSPLNPTGNAPEFRQLNLSQTRMSGRENEMNATRLGQSEGASVAAAAEALNGENGGAKQPDGQAEASDSEDGGSQIELLFTGDVLIHLPILNQGINGDGSSDFSWLFKYTAPLLRKADLAIGNMEGTIASEPFFGYPVFKAPDALAANLSEAGFDLMATVNNHCLDAGTDGLLSTLRALRAEGLQAIGTRENPDEPGFILREIKGIKLAFSAWSYESGRQGGASELRCFNDNPLPAWADPLLDSFSQEEFFIQEDTEKLRERARLMKAAGADLIVFIMHWGEEYQSRPSEMQQYYAKVLAEAGVDLLVGGHPHVVQPLCRLPAANKSGEMVCYYSLGNFVSNQQPETGDCGGRAEEGAIARVVVERAPSGEVRICRAEGLPLYMYKTYPGYPLENKTYGWALPAELALKNPAAFEASGLEARLEQALRQTREGMGEAPLR